ncbi:Uncharacterised protein at_DN1195 [Pycnogonum litorale]
MALDLIQSLMFSMILISSPCFGDVKFNMCLPSSVSDFLNCGMASVWDLISSMMEYTRSQTLILIVDNCTIKTHLKSLMNPKVYQKNYVRILVLNRNSTRLLYDPEMESSLILFLCSYRTVLDTMNWIMGSTGLLTKLSWIVVNNNKEWNTFELPQISPALKFFIVTFTSARKQCKTVKIVERYEIAYLYNDFADGRQRTSKIGYWSSADGLKMKKTFNNCCYNISSYLIRAVWIQHSLGRKRYKMDHKPANIYAKDISNIGYIGEIFSIIVETLKLRTELYEVPDKTYGDYDPKKETSYGLFHELHQQSADIAIGDLVDTVRRREVADFSTEIHQTCKRVIYSKPKLIESFYFYIKPFTSETWLLVSIGCLLSLLASKCLFSLSKKHKEEWKVLNVWAAFMNQGADLGKEDRMHLSFYQLSLYITVGLLAIFYSSKLLSMAAARFHSPPFTSMTELATQDMYIPVFSYGGATVQDILISTDEELVGIKRKLKSNLKLYVRNSSMSEIEAKLTEEKIAFVSSSEELNSMRRNNEDLEIMEKCYLPSGVYLAYRKEFPLRNIIDKLLIKMRQSGIVKRVWDTNFGERKKNIEDTAVHQINLDTIYVPLFILLVANIFSLIINTIIYVRNKYKTVNVAE